MRHTTLPARLPATTYGLALLAGLASCTAEDEIDPFTDLLHDTGFRQATAAMDDPLAQSVLDDIDATLPENQDATVAHPELFPAGFDPSPPVVSADTEVWVTFVQEGASYHSAMGYFTYPAGNPPASLTQQQLEDGLIFADASGTGPGLAGGGSLYNGVRMSLGTFQPGVQIGFYLVRNGACDDPGVGTCSSLGVDFTLPVYTTVDAMNPEYATDPGLARHVVMADLLGDPTSNARLLSFEDQDRLGGPDDDFNDVVFRVTATPSLGDGPPTIPNDECDFLDDPHSPGNGYLFVDTPMTRADAAAYCESEGSHLVTIGSAEEQAIIDQLTSCTDLPFAFIGLNDMEEEGLHVWEDGRSPSYSNAHAGEPNGGTGENCWGIVLNPAVHGLPESFQNRWVDMPCSFEQAFICETNRSNCNEDGTDVSFLEDPTDGVGGYYLVESPSNRTDAAAYCGSLGGYLVEINDAAEQALLTELAECTPGPLSFIGLNDIASEGNHVWEDGSSPGYSNPGVGEPNGGTAENCWAISLDPNSVDWLPGHYQDVWVDAPCDMELTFICEVE